MTLEGKKVIYFKIKYLYKQQFHYLLHCINWFVMGSNLVSDIYFCHMAVGFFTQMLQVLHRPFHRQCEFIPNWKHLSVKLMS